MTKYPNAWTSLPVYDQGHITGTVDSEQFRSEATSRTAELDAFLANNISLHRQISTVNPSIKTNTFYSTEKNIKK